MIRIDEVKKLGKLARIRLSETECIKLQQELEKILKYMDVLNENITSKTTTKKNCLESNNLIEREDVSIQSNQILNIILKDAPKISGDGFSVPTVIKL